MRRAPTTTEPAPRVVVVAVALALLLLAAAAPARAQQLARVSASFGDGARLGAPTSIAIEVAVAPGLAKVSEVRVLTPAGLDLVSSELGMATCAQPKAVVLKVMDRARRDPCPGNALMGTGQARAELRFDYEEIFDGAARIALYSGDTVEDKPGLVVIADSYRPIRSQLTYEGYLYVPPPGFGLGLAIRVRPVPRPPFDAPVALSSFGITIGDPSLTYVKTEGGRRVAYHPRAIPLPRECPAGGFHFRVKLRLADALTGEALGGQQLTADTRVPCPRAGGRRAAAQQ